MSRRRLLPDAVYDFGVEDRITMWTQWFDSMTEAKKSARSIRVRRVKELRSTVLIRWRLNEEKVAGLVDALRSCREP